MTTGLFSDVVQKVRLQTPCHHATSSVLTQAPELSGLRRYSDLNTSKCVIVTRTAANRLSSRSSIAAQALQFRSIAQCIGQQLHNGSACPLFVEHILKWDVIAKGPLFRRLIYPHILHVLRLANGSVVYFENNYVFCVGSLSGIRVLGPRTYVCL